ncbi:MAG: carboxypeptidase regulatory-like domain-containing protein [Archangiaceae bacterium]|nr:carboxypeptidase regulatory-like domain-containing protein [Archangiaceae bacterium]
MSSVALVVALCGCGNVPGLTSEDFYGLSPNPRVWLHGQVTHAGTGAPLPDVAIELSGYSTRSDRNGAYRLDGLTATEVSGSASAHGFLPQPLSMTLRPGANTRDIALQPQACGRYTCTADQFCDGNRGECVKGATLTGSVVDACTGAGLDARVTVDMKSLCSSAASGKSYFELKNITPGGPQVLAVGKTGYQAFSKALTLQPGFNVVDAVALTPLGGCAAGTPTNVACTCTESYCQ